MNYITSGKSYLLVSWFLSMSIAGFSQDKNFYKSIIKESIKESIKMDFMLDPMNTKPVMESNYIELDVNKKPLPKLGYNHKLNAFLFDIPDSLRPKSSISPYLTAFYTNQGVDPDAMETDGQVITNVLLVPLTAIVLLDYAALFDFLIKSGVIPYDDPVLPRETKKQKALRIITKEVYPTDDY